MLRRHYRGERLVMMKEAEVVRADDRKPLARDGRDGLFLTRQRPLLASR